MKNAGSLTKIAKLEEMRDNAHSNLNSSQKLLAGGDSIYDH